MSKTERNNHIFLFLRIMVVAAGVAWAAVWLSKGQRWGNLAAVFRRMNLAVFGLVLGIFVIGQLMVGLRWWLLLRTQSIFIDLLAAIRLHFLGLFYNNFMPSAVGGDLLRAWYVTKHTDRRFHAVLSVFVDRAIGLLGSMVIAIVFYLLLLRGEGLQVAVGDGGGLPKFFAEYKHKRIILWVGVALAAVFCGLLLHKRGRLLLGKICSLFLTYSRKSCEKFKDAVILYCSNLLAVLKVFGLTIFLQLLTITGFWILGMNMGVTAGIKYYCVFFPLGWAFGAIPVSIGGAVMVEGLTAYLFIHFAGVGAELALALALCQRIVWMAASLPGAVIHLVGAHLPKDFFIDYNKPVN